MNWPVESKIFTTNCRNSRSPILVLQWTTQDPSKNHGMPRGEAQSARSGEGRRRSGERRKKKVHQISVRSNAHGRGCAIEKLDSYAVILRNESFARNNLTSGTRHCICALPSAQLIKVANQSKFFDGRRYTSFASERVTTSRRKRKRKKRR